MDLQTHIRLVPEKNQIDYDSQLLLLGSCFTEHIGAQLEYFKFQNLQNPFGILFNPVSISKLVTRALTDAFFTEKDIFKKDSVWHCFAVHSLVFDTEKEEYLKRLNELLSGLKETLIQSSHIIFSLGTAWVHRFKETNEIVANCHKIPQKEFSKELLTMNEISKCLEEMVVAIQKVNPKVQILFTVSPVRHIKEGLPENNLSKSHLITAIHEVVASTEATHYFPSYEIMMDELRDYRFYEKDMIHPNETAIAIIWEKFNSVWVASETLPIQKEIDTIQRGLAHKPFHPQSTEHQVFLDNLKDKIVRLQARLPHLSFS
ncbi:GSCFA domain-containing protein [Aureisphaera galaxeae]|uniref:GSCFA domain-containing protein n=1 Tax=Aureisphaera galaxeae TaxID=1538023 RepID=UPI0023504B96|nr:GSCFA domain-containing protein [Aureisphaera galaxeae]MDC8003128.1 GSCFA domain-containing protein [Aureisphaera galaxeae]